MHARADRGSGLGVGAEGGDRRVPLRQDCLALLGDRRDGRHRRGCRRRTVAVLDPRLGRARRGARGPRARAGGGMRRSRARGDDDVTVRRFAPAPSRRGPAAGATRHPASDGRPRPRGQRRRIPRSPAGRVRGRRDLSGARIPSDGTLAPWRRRDPGRRDAPVATDGGGRDPSRTRPPASSPRGGERDIFVQVGLDVHEYARACFRRHAWPPRAGPPGRKPRASWCD